MLASGWRLITLLTVLALAAVPVARAGAEDDMAGHWAASEVQAARELGLVKGHPDGTFQPEESVTRGQFITLMTRVRGLPPKAGTGGFTDLAGHWLAGQGWIQAAVNAGLVVPADYGHAPALQPDKPITRVEAAVLMARTANRLGAAQTLHGAPLPFTDKVPEWATGFVAAVNSPGIFKGNGDGTFGVGADLTRAQAAAIALRTLKALQASAVPVWEANSWQVSSLPFGASHVTASWDNTLYWFGSDSSQVYRMRPFGKPELLATVGAPFGAPMAAGPDGLYVADGFRVLRVTENQPAAVWVGGEQGYRDGAGTEARFRSITGLCTDPAGNLYVTEQGLVRKVDRQGQVSTVAGLTPQQEHTYLPRTGDVPISVNETAEGPAYLIRMNPTGCAADGSGNLYIAGEGGTISKLTPDGMVSWYAGSLGYGDGTAAEAGFGRIKAMTAADPWGNLWLLDAYDRVRRITPDGHVYTTAGSGGRVSKWFHSTKQVWYPLWEPAAEQADGPGPDARFPGARSLTMAAGQLYLTDGNQSLRTITGRTDWYPGEKSAVLRPDMDDFLFITEGNDRYRPELVRLPVTLYSPAEGVGLLIDGQPAAEAHHPIYTLQWQSTVGRHRATIRILLPNGHWVEGPSRDLEVAEDGWSTSRAEIVQPRHGSWLQGVVVIRAHHYGTEAALKVDGKVLARGVQITSLWDTTRVADGSHVITLEVDGSDRAGTWVQVANRGYPPREPEGAMGP